MKHTTHRKSLEKALVISEAPRMIMDWKSKQRKNQTENHISSYYKKTHLWGIYCASVIDCMDPGGGGGGRTFGSCGPGLHSQAGCLMSKFAFRSFLLRLLDCS